MTFKVDDRVYETSTTTGSGDYTLDGAQVGFTAFSAMGANNLCPYFATDDTNWEVGIGTILIGPAKLQRTTILRSSNADAAVNWGAGTRKIRCGLPAAMAMPRILSKSVAGGANVTLTTDEQRRPVLEYTGLLTANIVINVDATPWHWIVYNNTTGAYTITFKVTGQTGVTVTQGRRKFCYCNGTDVFATDDEAAFASGTRMTFNQTSAPTGWTKETGAVYNNVGMRMVTGTVGTGGSDAFSTVFGTGKFTDNWTLSNNDTPARTHTLQQPALYNTGGASSGLGPTTGAWEYILGTTDSIGSGGAHAHTISNRNLAYIDVIVAQKN